jgi:hypothetical protein
MTGVWNSSGAYTNFYLIGNCDIFENNLNKSKFFSRRKNEQVEVRECLLSFGAESFVFQFFYPKIQRLIHRQL